MTYRPHLLSELRGLEVGKGMDEVLPGLLVGNYQDSKDMAQLEQHGVTHIVAVHDNARKVFKEKEYLVILAADTPSQNMLQYITKVNDFVHKARLNGGIVLIHCLAGMSRSVFLASSYIMAATALNAEEALRVVRSSRKIASPNIGFLRQLEEFQVCGLEEERRRLDNKFFNNRCNKDEDRANERLDQYYQLVGSGELCEGGCRPHGDCPAGTCRPTQDIKSFNIFRRRSLRGVERPTSAQDRQVCQSSQWVAGHRQSGHNAHGVRVSSSAPNSPARKKYNDIKIYPKKSPLEQLELSRAESESALKISSQHSRREDSWTSSGAMSEQVQLKRVMFGGGWERENRRSWREGEEKGSRIDRRRHGGNYLLSPKLSSLDHSELRGGKERKEPKKGIQLVPMRTRRRLPKSPTRKSSSLPASPRLRR